MWKRIRSWRLPFWFKTCKRCRKSVKKVEDKARNDRVCIIYLQFWTKMRWIPKLSDLAPVWFWSSKSRYWLVVIQPLFQCFVRFYHHQSIPFQNQNRTDSNAFGLSSCLVLKFEITILLCYCTVVVSMFYAILPPPVDLARSRMYIFTFLAKMLVLDLTTF